MAKRKICRPRIEKPLLAVVLAGGRGTRLRVLTEHRCKPEMPMGKLKIIDFTLANIVNSRNVDHAMILTQYMQQGIIQHLDRMNLSSHVWGKLVQNYPAQQRMGEAWYEGTANAVYQNHETLRDDPAETVAILAADHIYKLDLRQMLAFHRSYESQFTVCGMVMPVAEAARNYGVGELDEDSRMIGFAEKPEEPVSLPGKDGMCFGSMGIYLIEKTLLLRLLEDDHNDETSVHDFGKNVIPRAIREGLPVFGYDYAQNVIPGEVTMVDGKEVPSNYWRDVGRIGPYWEAQMDLVSVTPQLNLYNKHWPVPTGWDRLPEAKDVWPNLSGFLKEFGHLREDERRSMNILRAGGCIFDSPLRLVDSVFGRLVTTMYGASVFKCIVFDKVEIGHHAQLQYTIVDEGVKIPPHTRVGFDVEEDKRNGVYIDEDHDPHAWYPPIRVVTHTAQFG